MVKQLKAYIQIASIVSATVLFPAHAMNPLRNLGAKAAKFKFNANAFKAKVFATHEQPMFKTFKSHGSGGGYYNSFKNSAAAMPVLKVGALYGAYDRVKGWFGYGGQWTDATDSGKPFILTNETFTIQNFEKYPEQKEAFIQYGLAEMFNDMNCLITVLRIKQLEPERADIFAEYALQLFEKSSLEQLNQTTVFSPMKHFFYEIPFRYKLFMVLRETCLCPKKTERLAKALANKGVPAATLLREQFDPGVFKIFPEDTTKFNYTSQKIPLMQGIIAIIDNDSKALDTLLKPKGNSFLDFAYLHADKATKEILADKMRRVVTEKYGNFNFLPEGIRLNAKTIQILEKSKYPVWAFTSASTFKPCTQTEAHLFNYDSARTQFYALPSDIKLLATKIHMKEAAERAKGNYVFYHGHKWPLHFCSDVYKQLWNITQPEKAGSDFTFLRFNRNKKIQNIRHDSLFLNHALFGNSQFLGNSSMYYFLENRNASHAQINVEELFEDHKISKYYNKYKSDIQKLQELHMRSNERGNMLMVSIPESQIHWVKPTYFDGIPAPVTVESKTTTDTKKIVDALFKNPQKIRQFLSNRALSWDRDSDMLEYAMPLTTEYALDPKNGPRIYSFNAADKAKLKEYEAARDALFAKIKKDYEQDQAKK